MPPQHLVLDRRPQSVPTQHVVPCAIQLHQELHLHPWIHGTERDGVHSVWRWNFQLGGGQCFVSGVSSEELLPCSIVFANSVFKWV